MRRPVFLTLYSIFALGYCQFDFSNPYSAEQCASKLACSMNYSKVFDAKISELTYHHNLDLYKLRSFFVEKITPLERETEILRTNTSTMLQGFGREISNVYTTLSQDRELINNLTRGMYDLGKSLHGEIAIRMDDVHRLVDELRGVQNNLALLQLQVNELKGVNVTGTTPQITKPGQSCTSKINSLYGRKCKLILHCIIIERKTHVCSFVCLRNNLWYDLKFQITLTNKHLVLNLTNETLF